jgi:hypothetical protein
VPDKPVHLQVKRLRLREGEALGGRQPFLFPLIRGFSSRTPVTQSVELSFPLLGKEEAECFRPRARVPGGGKVTSRVSWVPAQPVSWYKRWIIAQSMNCERWAFHTGVGCSRDRGIEVTKCCPVCLFPRWPSLLIPR